MNNNDLMKLLLGDTASVMPLPDLMDRTSYDELIEIDMDTAEYSILSHTDNKYAGIISAGDFRRFQNFIADNLVHPRDRGSYRDFVNWDTLKDRMDSSETRGCVAGEFRLKSSDGLWIWTRQLIIGGMELGLSASKVRVYVYDIQHQKRRGCSEQGSLTNESVRYDEITGLPEGITFFTPIQKRMKSLEGWCVVDIEISHYKLFADWFGLESGHFLLAGIAALLRRYSDACEGRAGYIGQNEFCLVVPYDLDKIRELHREITSLIESISAIDGFYPQFGIAVIDSADGNIMDYFNKAGLTAEELENHETYTGIKIYNSKYHEMKSGEYDMLFSFRNAIANGEITFYLQPQYKVSTGRIVGAEALVRWRRSDGTYIPPTEFIPVLEHHGVVTRLDLHVWDLVCKWMHKCKANGLPYVPTSVNVSRCDISAIDVADHFAHLIEQYDLSPEDIQIEITESAYTDDFNPVRETIDKLRGLGFSVLMDDFGSGYSSLNMLRSATMDIIKLDAQFLNLDFSEMNKGISIIESVVNMTKNLSTPIIVEGVESEYQARFLSDLGCNYMQGYYFNKPMPVHEFEELISRSGTVDSSGFVFKSTQQMRVREFLDENIFTDVMLNNILGPVVFYKCSGDIVDIIRYNEQFFELVGISEEQLEERQNNILRYIHPEDRNVFLGMFRNAEAHPVIGESCVIRAIRPNGALIWIDLHAYYISSDNKGKTFYTSARDVTEAQFVNSDAPGAYYRCTADSSYTFMYISENYLKMTGFSRDDIRRHFNNSLAAMIHPSDIGHLRNQINDIRKGLIQRTDPFRIRTKSRGYIYVLEQSQFTDKFGVPCWQVMSLEVTDVVKIRNSSRILSRYLTDTILFLSRTTHDVSSHGSILEYSSIIYNLEDVLGLDATEFVDLLNSGEFCHWVEGFDDDPYYRSMPHDRFTEKFARSLVGSSKSLHIKLPSGLYVDLKIRADAVHDDKSQVEYIILLHEEE